ncbi:MAG TPA: hypothetical protein PKV24_21485, partial [Cyclobacteriaceae bacterium]|nr:hypothetical protein [Cyclobacteriaceae bacterium]
MKTQTLKLPTQIFQGISGTRFCSQRLFFNGTLCQVQFVKPGTRWFENPKQYYQVWDTYSMLTASGDGMKDVPQIIADELIFETEFGNYTLRPIRDTDKKIYGVNNFKGLFLEPKKLYHLIAENEAIIKTMLDEKSITGIAIEDFGIDGTETREMLQEYVNDLYSELQTEWAAERSGRARMDYLDMIVE